MGTDEVAAPHRTPTERILFTGAVIVWLIACARLALYLYVGGRYGYFIDELYFIACSNHLAWGYVDIAPLVALVVKISRLLFGDSTQSIRLFAALAGAASILLTGRLARELGGGRFAQGLAALSLFLAPVVLSVSNYISMNALELPIWLGCVLLIVRIVRTGNQKLWLWVGLLAGIGLNNKYSMAFLGAGIAGGLLLTAERRMFLKPWIWLAGLLAFLFAVPNLVWNIQNQFPFLQMMANRTANVPYHSLASFFVRQVVLLSPVSLPVWLCGLGWYLFDREGKRYRTIGCAFLIVAAIMLLPATKPYYMLPAYPMLLAAGAVQMESWFSRRGLRWLKPAYVVTLMASGLVALPFGLPVLSPATCAHYAEALHVAPPPMKQAGNGPLPAFFANQLGWEEMTRAVASAWWHLPREGRSSTAILARDFGEAGAIDLLGRKYGLPGAISGHQNYYLWGPREYTGESVLAIGFPQQQLAFWFDSVEPVGMVWHPYSMASERFIIYHCRSPKQPMAALWPAMKIWR